jgi:rare lipoprotein A
MVASWYGSKFHGRQTASGEIYNMYSSTAAHKTLPFGTTLKITHPESGRSVVVKITDRGPFIAGRDIDLSYGAAKKIGMVREGTARVMVDFLGRDMSYVKPVRYVVERGPFTIQVASFSDRSNATNLMSFLIEKHRDAYVTKAWIDGKLYYRVRIGRLSSRAAAEKIAEDLADEGYRVLVTRYEEVL